MDNKQKVNELISFLNFSFKTKTKKKNKDISILFELFDDNIEEITKQISVRIIDNKLIITDKKEKEHDTEIKIKTEIFIKLYSGNISAFRLFKFLLKSDDIETKDSSISKFRNFTSYFDFRSSKWEMFYLEQK